MAGHHLCAACAARPGGIEGHPDLHLDSTVRATADEAARTLFRCRTCHSLWARHYVGSGQFAWAVERVEAVSDA